MSEEWEKVVIAMVTESTARDSLVLWQQLEGESPRFNYRLEHVKAVVHFAGYLAERLGADREVVQAAAWLHDLTKETAEIYPEGDEHGKESAMEARGVLMATDFPQEKVNAVCEAIEKHVGLYKDVLIEPLEAAVVWDADKLAKLGATAIVHYLPLRPALSSLEGETTTEGILAEGEEWLALGQKMVASMNTALAREMAQERLKVGREFYAQLRREMGLLTNSA